MTPAEVRICSTPGCPRATRQPRSADQLWGMCDPCIHDLFAAPAAAPVVRLSETDPMSLAIAAEIAARSSR